MEIMERDERFFIFHAEEIPAEIASMMQGNNILQSLEIMQAERPEIFSVFIRYCQEFIGNEEIIPEDWESLKADFYAYLQA